MKLTAEAFTCAAFKVFNTPAAWRLLATTPTTFDSRDAGLLVADALTEGSMISAAELPLAFVELHMASGMHVLEPQDVLPSHELLGRWIGATAADALSMPIHSGAVFTNLAAGAPKFGAIELVMLPGCLARVRSDLHFEVCGQLVTASAFYGAALPEQPVVTGVRVSGDALFHLGYSAGMATREPAPTPPNLPRFVDPDVVLAEIEAPWRTKH